MYLPLAKVRSEEMEQVFCRRNRTWKSTARLFTAGAIQPFISAMLYAIALNGPFFNTHRMRQPYVLKAYFCTNPDSEGPCVEELRDYQIGQFLMLLIGAGTILLTGVHHSRGGKESIKHQSLRSHLAEGSTYDNTAVISVDRCRPVCAHC
jgi:hypothetical protein